MTNGRLRSTLTTCLAAGLLLAAPALAREGFSVQLGVGGGFSMIGGGYKDDEINRGMRGGLAEIGIGGKYYFTDWFSVGADFRVGIPFYDTWIIDWDDNETHDMGTKPDAYLMTLFLITAFHFST